MLPYIKKGKTSKDFQNLPVGKAGIFNPLLAPGNVAIYDGDVNCDAASWEDTAGGNSITFFNAPTYNAAGLNGHGTILFDGINQYGNSITPIINAPYTLYIVLKQVAWSFGKIIFADGVSLPRLILSQEVNTPEIKLQDAVLQVYSSDLTINSFKVITSIMNGTNSGLKIDLNSFVIGNGNNNQRKGINLSSLKTPSDFSNTEVAYIIMRNVADPTWLQNNFINWLKNRFAI